MTTTNNLPAELTELSKAQITVRMQAVTQAIEWSKHLASLATGTIVLSGTFLGQIFKNGVTHHWMIIAAWIALLISVITGSLTIGSYIAVINNPDKILDIDAYSSPAVYFAVFQAAMLYAGLGLFFAFVGLNF